MRSVEVSPPCLGHIQSGNVYSVLHHPVQGAEGDENPTFTIFNFKVPVNDIHSLHSWGWQGFQVLQGHAGAWNPVPKNVEKLRLTSGAAVCDLTLLSDSAVGGTTAQKPRSQDCRPYLQGSEQQQRANMKF